MYEEENNTGKLLLFGLSSFAALVIAFWVWAKVFASRVIPVFVDYVSSSTINETTKQEILNQYPLISLAVRSCIVFLILTVVIFLFILVSRRQREERYV